MGGGIMNSAADVSFVSLKFLEFFNIMNECTVQNIHLSMLSKMTRGIYRLYQYYLDRDAKLCSSEVTYLPGW